MPPTKPNLITEFTLLALLALLWGSSYTFIKIAVAEIPPFTLIATRVTIAAALLLLIIHWRNEKLPRDRKTWKMLFIQAIFNSIGAWTILVWCQQYIDSGLASGLNSTSPIFVFFITLFVTRHEQINSLKLLGSCIGVLGVILIVGVESLNGLASQFLGQMAALIGAFLYACGAIYGKKFIHLSGTITATGTMLWATICLVPLSLIIDKPWTLNPSLNAIFTTLVLSTLCTGGALIIYFRLIKTLGSMGVASQAYLRAGIGIILGVIFLGEKITLLMGCGLFAVIIGVIFINMPSKKPAK
ncbi:MAG: EamA family transporter [Alphaproteobacteria bacterium]|nr:EamA family transporter [Alphaproteobacteria bacterium]